MDGYNAWAFELESIIFTIVKKELLERLKETFPSIKITDKGQTVSKADFPTVYIHELPGVEMGADVFGTDINAVMETFQVDVTTNTSKSDSREIIVNAIDVFKQLRFQIVSMPEFDDDDDETYRFTARLRRVIGANDKLI